MSEINDLSISVIGSGSWGTALAKHLAEKGFDITQWVKEDEVRDSILVERENVSYLPGIKLPENIHPTTDLESAILEKDLLVFSIPSQFVRSVLEEGAQFVSRTAMVLNTAKGIELSSNKLLSEVFNEFFDADFNERYVVLSGPSFAFEVAREKPTAVSIASTNLETAKTCQRVFSNELFRCYVTEDVVGLEVGGSLKNVIAIAAGIVDGLDMGPNSRSALITRGLAEIARLGIKLGANPLTFAGLAGVGDLVLTATDSLSRNRTLGLRIGRGEKLENIIAGAKTVSEGVKTSQAALELSRSVGIDMPITEQVCDVLFKGKSPKEAIIQLMSRELKHETH